MGLWVNGNLATVLFDSAGLGLTTVVLGSTIMESSSSYRNVGEALSRFAGVGALILLLLWNPLVLHPRYWTATTVSLSVLLDAALIIAGAGLLCLRKLGGLALSAVSLLLLTRTAVQIVAFPWSLTLLLPIFFTAFLWRLLRWDSGGRAAFFILGSMVASGLLNYIAFLMGHG